MIPERYLLLWRKQAPWSLETQVEQDLVLSRAVVEIFSDPFLQNELAFRGGTALHKLYLTPPARYSEDIDLVQIRPGPLGDLKTRDSSCLLGKVVVLDGKENKEGMLPNVGDTDMDL